MCVVTLYPLKLALASLTGGDRSIGIVRLRTKTTEFFMCVVRIRVGKCIVGKPDVKRPLRRVVGEATRITLR
jgi:hypothetical protein